MRKCLRCGTAMMDNYAIRIDNLEHNIVMTTNQKEVRPEKIGKLKTAVCPECGEISFYIDSQKNKVQL